MFRFGAEELLFALLALPVIAVFLVWGARRSQQALERFGDLSLVQRLSSEVNRSGRRAKRVLLVCAVGFLIFALSRPQFGTRVETVRRQGLDIVVAMDISRSMLAEDIAPNRLAKAKFAVSDLIRRLDGDRIGLVAFAGEAFVQSPLTVDYSAALLFLNAMEPSIVSVQGTNLAAALERSLDAFDPANEQDRILIVITDGEDHEGSLEESIERAREVGVRIFAVGMGTPQGVPIPGTDGGFMRDEDGTVVTSRLDEATLRSLAETTGGTYYRATARGSELDELSRELAGQQGQELDARQVTLYEEQFQLFVGLALVLLLVEMLIPDRRRISTEWEGRVA